MGIKHPFVSGIADAGDATKVRPSNWNANHTIDGDVDFSGHNIVNCPNLTATGPTGPTGPQGPPGTGTIWINVTDFGAVGDGSTDDTTSIQAAIDYAATNSRSVVFMPAGRYKTTRPLFLDHPSNLRGPANPAWSAVTTYAINDKVFYLGMSWVSLSGGNLNNTPSMSSTFWQQSRFEGSSIFGFSLNLLGDSGAGSFDNNGSRIYPDFYNGVAIYIGPGQGMMVSHVNIVGPADRTYRGCGMSLESFGIAVAASNAGTSRTSIEHVCIANFNTGIGFASCGGGGLGDSNRVSNSFINNCDTGIIYGTTQAQCNSLIDTNINYCHKAIVSTLGTGCNVVGGNHSPVEGASCVLSIGSISALTAVPLGLNCYYTFTATLDAPAWSNVIGYSFQDYPVANYLGKIYFAYNTFVGLTPDGTSLFGWINLEHMATLVFKWALITANFGVIALECTAYDPVTRIANFKIEVHNSFCERQNSILGTSQLQADVQAATSVYAAELPIVYFGTGFNVTGSFIEESLVGPMTIVDTTAFFGGAPRPCVFTGCFNDTPQNPSFFLYGYNNTPGWTPKSPQYANVVVGMVHPMIKIVTTSGVILKGTDFNEQSLPPMIWGAPLEADRNFTGFNLSEANPGQNNANPVSTAKLDGTSWGTFSTDVQTIITSKRGGIQFYGLRPDPQITPPLSYDDFLAALNPAAIVFNPPGVYTTYPAPFYQNPPSPCLYGGQTYQITEIPLNGLRDFVDSFTGRVGAGAITGAPFNSGSKYVRVGDAVLWVFNLTDQADATSSFERFITVDQQLQQTSAVDLSLKKFQVAIKTTRQFISKHGGWSYGQDFTTTNVPALSWRYKGGSSTVYMDFQMMQWMFNGLTIGLSDGVSNHYYLVKGVFFQWPGALVDSGFGYVSVEGQLSGAAATVFTGNLIKQQPFDFVIQ